MRLIAKVSYSYLIFPEEINIGELVNALSKAKIASYDYTTHTYKEVQEDFELSFVSDVKVKGLPEQDKIYLEDIKRANDRASNLMKERDELKAKLEELETRFAPFMEKKEPSC